MFAIVICFSIIDVAVCKDEIFVLEEDRSLIRLSYHPENNDGN